MRKCIVMFAVWVIVLVIASLVTKSDEDVSNNEVVMAQVIQEKSGERP